MRSIVSGCLLSLLCATAAHAQPEPEAPAPTCSVTLEQLTVDGRTPPSDYSELLTRAVTPTVEAVLGCYRDRLRHVPDLDGELQLRLWVSARQVIRVTPERAVSDDELQGCAVGHVRAFTLPPEAPRAGASVRFVLRFDREASSDAPGAGVVAVARGERPPPFVVAAVAIASGPRTQEELTAALPATAFFTCAAEGVAGPLELELQVSSRGRVRSRRVGGEVSDAAVVRCAIEQTRAAPFEATSGATRARLVLIFSEP